MGKLIKSKIKGHGQETALYLLPLWEKVDKPLTHLAPLLGYNSHTNLATVRNGNTRIPLSKIHNFIKIFEPVGLDPFHFSQLVIKQHIDQQTIDILIKSGVLSLSK